MRHRKAAVAGSFYPSNPSELSDMITNFLSSVNNARRPPKIAIVPHAGYVYSGLTAAAGYAAFLNATDHIRRAVIIGPAHYVDFSGIAAPTVDYFSTPLGDVPIDKEGIKEIEKYIIFSDEAHKKEHSIEVQIPFIQTILPNCSIIPLVAGDVDFKIISRIVETLWGGSETIFIISTDLSHYHLQEDCKKIDTDTALLITKKQLEELHGDRACGFLGVQGALYTANKLGIDCVEVTRTNSGGDRAVGYGAYHIGHLSSELIFNKEYKNFLLSIARQSIIYGVKNNRVMSSFADPFDINIKRATFVTIEKHGMLRGCIGSLSPTQSVVRDVVRNAYSAAFNDTRFSPVTDDEISALSISISILSSPIPMTFSSEQDLLKQVIPGKSGLILRDNGHCGTFLPSVWDDIKDKADFLNSLKEKAGLSRDHWSDTITCMHYTTDYFSDKA